MNRKSTERDGPMKHSIRLAIVAAVLGTSAVAFAIPPPSGGRFTFKDTTPKSQPMGLEPARKIEKLPSSIEVRVGQKRSFSGVYMAGVMDPRVVKIHVDNNVLTVLGLKPGKTQVTIHKPTKGPPTADQISKAPQIWLTVTQ